MKSLSFDERAEKVFLYLPLLLFLALPIGQIDLFSSTAEKSAGFRFASNFLFLNTTHFVMSIALFSFLPGYRQWRQERASWLYPGVLIAFFVGIYASDFFRSLGMDNIKGWLFLAMAHNVLQSMGFMILLQRQSQVKQWPVKPAHYLLLIALVFKIWDLPGAFLVTSFAVMWILIPSLKLRSQHPKQIIFSCRYLAYLLPLTPEMLFIIMSTHYLEMIGLGLNCFTRGEEQEFSKSKILIFLLAGTSFLSAVTFFSIDEFTLFHPVGLPTWLLLWSGSIHAGISMSHFFLDGLMYRSSTGGSQQLSRYLLN